MSALTKDAACPAFVAIDLSRIPNFDPSADDVCSLGSLVHSLHKINALLSVHSFCLIQSAASSTCKEDVHPEEH